jgi:hypothetical protein
MAFILASFAIAVIFFISIFNFALLKYYQDPHESIKFVIFMLVYALTLPCLHGLLIPIDQQNALDKNKINIKNLLPEPLESLFGLIPNFILNTKGMNISDVYVTI